MLYLILLLGSQFSQRSCFVLLMFISWSDGQLFVSVHLSLLMILVTHTSILIKLVYYRTWGDGWNYYYVYS